MTESDLLALTGNEIRQSLGYRTGKLSEARRRALQFYLARPVGELAPPEIEGRSSVVATDVADTINWMMPNLVEVFTSGENVVEFMPQLESDTEAAKQATDYVNYIFYRQNPGFRIMRTWIFDALLQKNGIVKVWWDHKIEETREDYTGLSDNELAQLLKDKGVEPIEHTERVDEADLQQREEAIQHLTAQLQQAQQAQGNPQAMQAAMQMQAQLEQINQTPPKMVHDVTIKRTANKSQVRIENVPPEEFLISRDAKNIKEARFCAHQVLRTLSDLKARGYKNVDSLTTDDTMSQFAPERVERQTWNDEQGWLTGTNEMPNDPTQRQIWVSECYVKCDYDGDGIAEWRKVTRAGNTILDNEECDGPPFVAICPNPLPHQFFGLSIADQAIELQKQRTSVLRAQLDNLYLSVNGRYYAVEQQVNLDDLLTSRPGGVVRIKAPGAVGRLDQGASNENGGYQMLEYLEQQRENATGWTRYSQGLNPDALQSTATGTHIVTQRADKRLELVAREFAETGVTELFRMILTLITKHQEDKAVVNLSGNFVEVDPRSWRNQFDMTINVGLGTGDKQMRLQQVQMLMAMQEKVFPLGVSDPQNIYNAASETAKLMGYKSTDKFFSDPSKQPPKPPQPNPEIIKAQAQMQVEQQKMQLQDQQHQREMQLSAQVEQMKQDAQDRQAAHQKQMEAERDAAKAQMQAQVDMHKQQLEAAQREQEIAFEKWKAELQAQTQIYIAQLGAGSQEPVETNGNPDNVSNALAASIDGFRAAIEQMGKPKTIIRGPDGRAQGIA